MEEQRSGLSNALSVEERRREGGWVWSAESIVGAQVGIEECSLSRGAPKRGRVGKEWGIHYRSAGGN